MMELCPPSLSMAWSGIYTTNSVKLPSSRPTTFDFPSQKKKQAVAQIDLWTSRLKTLE